jgi:hypothetical protein
MQIIFYLFANGHTQDGKTLSDLGERQVRESTIAHLKEIVFFTCISSGENNSCDTVETVRDQTPTPPLPHHVDRAFGWEWSAQVYPDFGVSAAVAYKDALGTCNPPDILSILQARPRLWQLRGSMMTGILSTAQSIAYRARAQKSKNEPIHVLVTTHHFLVSLCAMNPFQNWSRHADIMRIQVDAKRSQNDDEIYQSNITIAESTLLHCPPINYPD